MRERARAVKVLAVPCAVAVVALAIAAAVPAAGGCTTHQCDPDCVRIGAPPDSTCSESNPDAGAGVHVYRNGDQIIWETSDSVFQPWLDYPGQRTYELNWQSAIRKELPGVDLCTLYVVNVDTYVATDPNGGSFVNAAGQLAEMTYPLVVDDDAELPHVAGADADGGASANLQANGQVNVTNGTCAEYFLRVVVTLQVGAPICGCHRPCTDAAAGSSDAGDAAADGG